MKWMLLDELGNAFSSFDDEVSAHAAFRSLAADEPEAADRALLLAYNDDGRPSGEAVTFDDLPVWTFSVVGWCAEVPLFWSRSTRGLSGGAKTVTTSARTTATTTEAQVLAS